MSQTRESARAVGAGAGAAAGADDEIGAGDGDHAGGTDSIIEVRVDSLAPGGDAVGRQQGGAADGRATFVALAAPGDVIQARITRQRSRVAWAELTAIRAPSAHRVVPECPLFGRCGGCQWQHVDLAAQRAAKQAIAARALGLAVVPLVVPVADGRGYRDRTRLTVGSGGEVGFHARRSHDVVDVTRCLLLSPMLQEALPAVRRQAAALPAGTAIDLQAGREGIHAGLRIPASSRGALAKEERQAAAGVDPVSLLAAWRAGGIVGLSVRTGARGRETAVGVSDVDISGGRSDGGQLANRGEPDVAPLRIPAGAFAQVGHDANRVLVAAVLQGVGADPGAVLELYAGSGNFTRILAARATRILACDGDGAAVARGRRNVPSATWRAHPPGVVDADTVVVDPPRDGLDGENLRAALQARRRIVYVSCDPQTLGRDAALLARAGFILRGAQALDLMPHTFHVEVVASFDRGKNPEGG